eukprot:170744_1
MDDDSDGEDGLVDDDDDDDSLLNGKMDIKMMRNNNTATQEGPFDDERFFKIKNERWNKIGVSDPISNINKKEKMSSYVMLKELTKPLTLSDLLGDFQKAGQIMLSRIDDMQSSLTVEKKLHSGVLKAHQLEEKYCLEEKEELLQSIEKLENELKLLRD